MVAWAACQQWGVFIISSCTRQVLQAQHMTLVYERSYTGPQSAGTLPRLGLCSCYLDILNHCIFELVTSKWSSACLKHRGYSGVHRPLPFQLCVTSVRQPWTPDSGNTSCIFTNLKASANCLMDPVGAQTAQRLQLSFEPGLTVNSERGQWSPKKHEWPGTVSRPERSGTFQNRHHLCRRRGRQGQPVPSSLPISGRDRTVREHTESESWVRFSQCFHGAGKNRTRTISDLRTPVVWCW